MTPEQMAVMVGPDKTVVYPLPELCQGCHRERPQRLLVFIASEEAVGLCLSCHGRFMRKYQELAGTTGQQLRF